MLFMDNMCQYRICVNEIKIQEIVHGLLGYFMACTVVIKDLDGGITSAGVSMGFKGVEEVWMSRRFVNDG
jgi:hypothetical protein